ncbi:MAG: hypothetical protein ACI814_002814 [Mariniblastus sp.]|jgi:hypothetical protein
MNRRICFVLAFFVATALGSLNGDSILAQNINVGTPLTHVSDSYYENLGTRFGFSIPGGRGNGSRIVGWGPQGQFSPNIVFSQNGSGGAIPPFGGYSPNASFGFGRIGRNGGGFSLGLNLAKGSTRTSTTVAPSLTVQNGNGGSLINGQFRPFVTGVVPVVGNSAQYGQPVFAPDNGVTRAMQSGQLNLATGRAPETHVASSDPVSFSNLESTASAGDFSVSSIKAERKRRIEERKQQFIAAIKEAQVLESQSKYAEARMKYQSASSLTDDKQFKAQIKLLIKATRLK